MELGDGAGHILPELLAPQGALLQIGLQVGPQVRLILVMLQKRIGVVLIVGKGKGVRQVVGEFPQGVVLPHGPVLAALETLDLALDVCPRNL